MNEFQNVDRVLSDSLQEGWRLFSSNLTLFVLASLVYVVLGVLSLGILIGPLTIGMIHIVRRCQKGKEVQLQDLFSGFSLFVPSALATLVLAILVSIGFVLLVLPGLLLLTGWLFTFHVMERDENGPLEAMASSWRLFKEHAVLVGVTCLLVVVATSVGSAVFFGAVITTPLSIIFLTVVFDELTGAAPQKSAQPDGLAR